jgi:hypothetical protein
MNKLSLFLLFIIAVCLAACNSGNQSPDRKTGDSTSKVVDTPKIKYYSNERFKDVWVEPYNDTIFVVRGKAQVFEATFSWIIEDGHNELRAGSTMTDAGAPAWGRFRIPISIKKMDPNTTLTLVLFETSPKDGSRQHELPIPLF